MKLDEMKNEFLNYYSIYYTFGTYRYYCDHLPIIVKFLGNKDVDLITKKDIEDFILYEKSKNLSNSTINKRILCLKTMFKFFNINSHDVLFIKKLKQNVVSFKNLNYNDLQKVIHYVENSKQSIQSKLIVFLILESGVRLNELLNIKIKNINYNDRIILLEKTKNSKERYIFYSNLTEKYIKLFDVNSEDTYLLKIKKSGVISLIYRMKKMLKINIHCHCLRHTYASILCKNNTNIDFISTTLGHSSLETTKIYLHMDTYSMKKIYNEHFYI